MDFTLLQKACDLYRLMRQLERKKKLKFKTITGRYHGFSNTPPCLSE